MVHGVAQSLQVPSGGMGKDHGESLVEGLISRIKLRLRHS